jgi:hypothetical protein
MRLVSPVIALGLLISLAPAAHAGRAIPAVLRPSAETQMCIDAVNRVIASTRQDAADMRAMAAKARAAGNNDIAAVYDRMAAEHSKHVDEQIAALATYGVTPMADASVNNANMPADLEHAIAMHREVNAKYVKLADTETCSVARKLYLVLAVCSSRHISELQALQPPVAVVATEPTVIFMEKIVEVPVERVVVQEKIVEKRVEVPGPERIVERIVERPSSVASPATRPAPRRVPRRRPAN